MGRKLYIETVGCQMNLLDSELVVAALRQEGYELAATPQDADAILFNTCSVRQHAEDKIYSALGRLKNAKEERPGRIIGVLGCMAQKDQELIFRRAPFVDLVVGPGQLHQLPSLFAKVAAGRGRQMEVSLDRKSASRAAIERSFESYDPLRDPTMRPSPFQAFVRVMIGCDKFCTYCIVPSVRGPEQSRDPAHIEAEVRKLAAEGCREITLLGQTVNSYKFSANGTTVRFADLLHRLHEVPGLDRIKFITNFPKDMTNELLFAVRDLPKVCRYLHVPAQSGSNAVLKRMKRGYTVEEYWDMLHRIRDVVPDAAVTSDFIVGFCGETHEDYLQTEDLVRRGDFKNSFIFKYSPRPGVKSAELFPDDVPEEVKKDRNNALLAIQTEVCRRQHDAFVGRTVEILVEGPSKTSLRRDADAGPVLQLTGRTMCDRIVVFRGTRRHIGQILPVHIDECTPFTLFGSLPTRHVSSVVDAFDLGEGGLEAADFEGADADEAAERQSFEQEQAEHAAGPAGYALAAGAEDFSLGAGSASLSFAREPEVVPLSGRKNFVSPNNGGSMGAHDAPSPEACEPQLFSLSAPQPKAGRSGSAEGRLVSNSTAVVARSGELETLAAGAARSSADGAASPALRALPILQSGCCNGGAASGQ